MFDLQPNLQGTLIKMRPLQPEDFESLYAVASDPLLWSQHPESNRYRRNIFEIFFRKAIGSKGALLVLNAQTDAVIGSSRFYDFSPEKSQIAVGYTFLGRKYWGKGHNQEMKLLMLEHAFQFVNAVIFHIGENNFRSKSAIEKTGAKLHEKFETKSSAGNPYKTFVYRIQKSTFLKDTLNQERLLSDG